MFTPRRVRCRHRRSVTCVLYILAPRRVWCRRRRSVAGVLYVFSRSGDEYAMKKSVAVLPRDPYVFGAEITPSVYEFRPDKRIWSSCFLGEVVDTVGPLAIVSPVVKGRRRLRLGYGIAGVEHHMQPEC